MLTDEDLLAAVTKLLIPSQLGLLEWANSPNQLRRSGRVGLCIFLGSAECKLLLLSGAFRDDVCVSISCKYKLDPVGLELGDEVPWATVNGEVLLLRVVMTLVGDGLCANGDIGCFLGDPILLIRFILSLNESDLDVPSDLLGLWCA